MTTYLFNAFSQQTKSSFERRSVNKGETVFQLGEPADRLYMVVEGCIRMVVYPHANKELVLYRARDGEAFAEEHLIHENYTYRAIADQDTELSCVEKAEVLREFSSDLSTARSFMSCVCKRYYQLRTNFERIGINSASERVLHWLQTLSETLPEIDLTGKIKSYAHDLNLSHEAVYRALRELEEQRLIERAGGKLRLVTSA